MFSGSVADLFSLFNLLAMCTRCISIGKLNETGMNLLTSFGVSLGGGVKSYLLPSTVCSEPLCELLAQCQWYWSKVYVPSPPPWCKAPPLMYNCATEQWRRNPFKDFWSKLTGQRMIKTYISRIFQSNLSTMTGVFEKRLLFFKTLQKILYDI